MKTSRSIIELWVLSALVLGALLGLIWGLNVLGVPVWAQVVLGILLPVEAGNLLGAEFRELRREAKEHEDAGSDDKDQGKRTP